MAENKVSFKQAQVFKGFSSKAANSNYKLYDFELIKQDLKLISFIIIERHP